MIISIPFDPKIIKETVYDQSYFILAPKLQQAKCLKGVFYVENYELSNKSIYKGLMRKKEKTSENNDEVNERHGYGINKW